MNYIITSKPDFIGGTIRELKPKYLFFPHWSDKVPKDITQNYRCITFHEGEVPGGSPIQNLILDGVEDTIIRAIVMNDTIDGGKVIYERHLSLEGTVEEILLRESRIVGEMINEIQANNW